MPPEDLRCAEYCFQCCSSPSHQDSPFDKSIHHRDALLTALNNSCGGLVLLTAAEETPRKTIEFSTFPPSSSSTLSENVKTSQLAVPGNVWCVKPVKRSSKTALYKLDGDEVELKIDINGKLRYVPHPGQPGNVENPAHEREQRNPKAVVDPGDDSTEASQPPTKKPRVDTVASSEPPVVVSELNWDQNKDNWSNILQGKEESVDEYISSCDFLELQMPMQLTPEKGSLRDMFSHVSDSAFEEMLQKLGTKTPGFAIAARSWLSHLPAIVLLKRPPNHLCDIFTVSKDDDSKPNICLWVVVLDSKEHIIREQLQYMFMIGRAIKYQIANQSREMPNLAIRCMLHSTDEEGNYLIKSTLQELRIQGTQDFLCSVFLQRSNTFETIKQGIARLLLSQESHVKSCAGEQLSVILSKKQVLTLLKMKRFPVWYVSSAPGTGKTLCGLALYKDFGQEDSVYICPTEPLLQYLRYNGCEATLVRNDEDLHAEINQGVFDNKKCVIIDESHHLRCSKETLKELFLELKKHKMSLFVFADNEFQSFDIENQQNIEQYIHDLSKEVLKHRPQFETFTKMYRNPRKIVSFLQHAIEEPDLEITCGNPSDGEGVQAISLKNLWDNSRDNGLVQYLQPMVVLPGSSSGRYHMTQVAVLLDSGHSSSHVETMGQILKTQLPFIGIQCSAKFPRKGITVDKIESFVGLDAPLCIFLLSAERSSNLTMRIANMRYRVFLASRATRKAVFVVSKIDAELIECLKFDRFPVSTQFPLLAELMAAVFMSFLGQGGGTCLHLCTCVKYYLIQSLSFRRNLLPDLEMIKFLKYWPNCKYLHKYVVKWLLQCA